MDGAMQLMCAAIAMLGTITRHKAMVQLKLNHVTRTCGVILDELCSLRIMVVIPAGNG